MKKITLMTVAVMAITLVACESTSLVKTVEEQQFSEARVLQVETHAKIDSVQARLNVFTRVEWSKDYSYAQVESLDFDINALHGRAADRKSVV